MKIKKIGGTIQIPEELFRVMLKENMPDLAEIEQHVLGVIADPRIELVYGDPECPDIPKERPNVPMGRGERSREAQRRKSSFENTVVDAFRSLGPFRRIQSTTWFFGYKFSWFDINHPEFHGQVSLINELGDRFEILVGPNFEARCFKITREPHMLLLCPTTK
ncbi:MAG: hypothetical protein Q7R84_03600 [bacterium]|nr:hypothetical protein [bacterium]